MTPLRAPFPYFGGKSAIAQQVWCWLGEVPNYVEPFFGSGAVLLGRPGYDPARHTETVNDADGLLCNFWRAVTADPDQVAHYADWPVNENDLHARHAWLVGQKDSLQARLEGDPEYYEAKIAGWWVWGLCCWIGRRWCHGKGPWSVVEKKLVRNAESEQGIHRVRVHLSDASRRGILHASASKRLEWFQALQERLRWVRVCCGEWQRVCGHTVTTRYGITGMFLDPPYSATLRDAKLYRVEADIAHAIQQWCLTHGADPLFRIVLCGYAAEHDVLLRAQWHKWTWKANGGYGNTGHGSAQENAARETCWMSPHCLEDDHALPLFATRNRVMADSTEHTTEI